MVKRANYILAVLLCLYSVMSISSKPAWGIVGICGAMLVVVCSRYISRSMNNRVLLLDRLAARPDCDLGQEIVHIQRKSGMSPEDLGRIWQALAVYYEVPESKLRHEDGLDAELAGLNGLNHDIYMSSFLLFAPRSALSPVHSARTWSDLVIAIASLESLMAKRATCLKEGPAGPRHVLL